MNVPLLEAEDTAAPASLRPSSGKGTWRERASGWAKRLRPLLPDALVVAWVSCFHYVVCLSWRFAKIAYDEHFFLTEGWSVLKGQVPYRDFQEFKPPVIFFVNALALKLFGLDGLGYRKLLTLLSLAAFLALTVALLSRRVNRWLVVGLLMLMIDHFLAEWMHQGSLNNAETLALNFFSLGVGVLLTRTKWLRTQQVLGGVLLALSPLSKEPMAFATVGAWLSLLLLQRSESEQKGAAQRFVLFTLAGVATVAATWLIYMLATGSLEWYVLQLKLNFAYAENYAYQTEWVSRNPEGGPVAELVRQLRKGYLNIAHLGAFIPFFVALAVLRRTAAAVRIGALATFAAALYGVSVGHGFSPNYFIMAMTGTFLCVALGAIALDASAQQSSSELRHWLATTWVVVALATAWPRFQAEWKNLGKLAAEPSPVAQSDIDLVHAHTTPADTIWATDDPLLYVFSDRVSAFRGGIVLDEIIDYYPGTTDRERLAFIRQGLEANRPKLVVLGDSMVSAKRKRRYMKVLVKPFLRDHGYRQLNDRFYLRPD